MRKKVIAGNWKMYKNAAETKAYFDMFLKEIDTDEKEVIIFPPFTSISSAVCMTVGSNVKIGAQNMHYEDCGAFTGEVSCGMINETGACYVLIGHSERRKYFNEKNETVNKKVSKALGENLIPVVCIGEDLSEREDGKTYEILFSQLTQGLKNISDAEKIIIAYEPIWAIGTGKTATDLQAEEACAKIREYLFSMFGDISDKIRILYGGSVNASNIKSLMSMANIDGVLVGGASLNSDFIKIVQYDK